LDDPVVDYDGGGDDDEKRKHTKINRERERERETQLFVTSSRINAEFGAANVSGCNNRQPGRYRLPVAVVALKRIIGPLNL
jgi:hypothetical protein